MGIILSIDNDAGWNDWLQESFRDVFRDPDVVVGHTGVAGANQEPLFAAAAHANLVLLDLELGRTGSLDTEGRDTALPLLRRSFRWLPVILVSSYLGKAEAPQVLGEVSPFGFDGIVSKDFFTSSSTNAATWKKLRVRSELRRIGSLTQRDLPELEEHSKNPPHFDYGEGVRQALEKFDSKSVREVLALLGLGPGRLVLDQVVQGFSGLAVVRVTAHLAGARASWLVKVGSPAKLDREAQAHRRLFVEGFTRRWSVPLLHSAVVAWRGIGAIAYEFEQDAQTLLACAERDGCEMALDGCADALRELYSDGVVEAVIPRSALRAAVSREALTPVVHHDESAVAQAFVRDEPLPSLDESKVAKAGRQHGDLHARNILRGPHGTVLIDFAHFRAASQGGLPLGDAAKLLLDLCVLSKTAWWTPTTLVDGSALSEPRIESWLRRSGVLIGTNVSDSEAMLFRTIVEGLVIAYLGYDDVGDQAKVNLRAALRRVAP